MNGGIKVSMNGEISM